MSSLLLPEDARRSSLALRAFNVELAQAGIHSPAGLKTVTAQFKKESALDFLTCPRVPGEGLGFPEDPGLDANAVLEDGRRGHLQRRPSEPAHQHRAVEGRYVRQKLRRWC